MEFYLPNIAFYLMALLVSSVVLFAIGRTIVCLLPECDRYADTLVRLPMYYDLEIEDVDRICQVIQAMYNV